MKRRRSGIVTGAKIALALIDEVCEPTVAGIAGHLGISTNSVRKALGCLVEESVIRQTAPKQRPGTPPTAYFYVKGRRARETEPLLEPLEGSSDQVV